MGHSSEISILMARLSQAQKDLRSHDIYGMIKNVDELHIFMTHHIFAVWDFMSLLKLLQQRMTCVEVPWRPRQTPRLCRLINEIVLEEESDLSGDGGFLSHFELYRQAMAEAGADMTAIGRFLERLDGGMAVGPALAAAGAPAGAIAFVGTTFGIIDSGRLHAVAAAFTFGREEPIPGMFRALIGRLAERFPNQLGRLVFYLDRHIHLDETQHTPLAMEMTELLCGDDPVKWREASDAAVTAVQARLALWSAISDAIHRHRQAAAHASCTGQAAD
jgi:hypothetical protein